MFLRPKDGAPAARTPARGTALGAKPSAVPKSVRDVLRSPGEPLDPVSRAYFEPRFGWDLSRVRVHADDRAAASAREMGAKAYTIGRHLVFGPRRFDPSAQAGRTLLAHELAHAIQQRAEGAPPPDSSLAGRFERSATLAAHDVGAGRPLSTILPACGVGISRDAEDDPDETGLDARDQAVAEALTEAAEAQALLADTDEVGRTSAADEARKFLPGGFGDADIPYGKDPQQDRADYEKLRQQEGAESRKGHRERLIVTKMYLIEHSLTRSQAMEILTNYLTAYDMSVLMRHGLKQPGAKHGGDYGDEVIEAIDKSIDVDREAALRFEESRQNVRRAAAAVANVAESNENLAGQGAFALAGRLVCAGAAYPFADNWMEWGELCATAGSVGDSGMAMALASRAQTARRDQPNSPAPRPRIEETAKTAPAPMREPLPMPDGLAPEPPAPAAPPSRASAEPPAAPSAMKPEDRGYRPLPGERTTTRAQYKAQQREQRASAADDKALAGDLSERVERPEVTGTAKSGYYIGGKKVPPRPPRRLDVGSARESGDVTVPTLPGETGRQGVARLRTVIGTKISDHALLERLWNDARASILSRRALTEDSFGPLYEATREAFWRRVRGNSEATRIFEDAGLEFWGDAERAPRLRGVDPGLKRAETGVSLDHDATKAIGDNWRKALDADNLTFMFAMPNTERENKQRRHPELRE